MSKLKEARENAGMSQGKLADASGVSVRMIQKYEQGERDFNKAQVLTAYQLAQALNTTVEELIEKDEPNDRTGG